MKTIKYLLAAFYLAGPFQAAHATPVQWTLPTTQTTYPTIQPFGTFDFDADTDTYSNFDMSFYINGLIAKGTFGLNAGDANGFNYGTYNGTGVFYFAFDTPLTDAGGIVTGTESDHGGTHAFFVQAASVTSAVPEPTPGVLLSTGLGLLCIARRRKASAGPRST